MARQRTTVSEYMKTEEAKKWQREEAKAARRARRHASRSSLRRWWLCLRVLMLFVVCVFVLTVVMYNVGLVAISRWLGDSEATVLTWWQRSIIYQVYPRSFYDSNGDGVGDLNGITLKLDYLQQLGVGAVWISPFFTSPMADFGYDIANFTDVDGIFGNLQDFDALVQAAHDKDLKVILDLVPNHTSDQHPWFIESCKSEKNHYTDYYIWRHGKRLANGTVAPPNNWVSVFGGSMWEWHPGREMYYLHQFTKQQPDLDYNNPRVRDEFLNVFSFWLDRGVDGFRIDAARHLFEHPKLPDEELSNMEGVPPSEYNYLIHDKTTDQPKTHELLTSWRMYLEAYTHRTDKHIFMMVEIFELTGSERVMPYYRSGADFPFNFNLQAMNRSCGSTCVHHLVDDWLGQMPRGAWPNWVIGSHDTPRISHKVGVNMVSPINLLLLTLPGTAVTYYGEELGMMDLWIPYENTVDPAGINAGQERYELFSRDPCRTPMQWSAEKNAGFSRSSSTWLPVHTGYKTRNVQAQLSDPTGASPIQIYRRLARLRDEASFAYGEMDYCVINNNVFSYIRYASSHTAYLVAINFGSTASTDDYRNGYKGRFITGSQYFVPEVGSLVMTSANVDNSVYSRAGNVEEEVVLMRHITLQPQEAIIVRFWPDS